MKRNKPRTLPIGSVSSGTLRSEDLISSFLWDLGRIRLTRAERTIAREIATHGHDEDDPDTAECMAEDVSALTDIMEAHCPDYCYFGTTDGDGAEFGVWPTDPRELQADPDVTCINDRYPSEYEQAHERITTPYALHVNDHGNCTLYRRASNRWIEVWSIV